MSVQGVVADRLGDHAGAMQFYRDALKIAPGEPGVLTNMGLSLALAKQLPEAEQALRQAVASPKADARMRGDLALVLALEGKFGEAEKAGMADLSPEAARANVEAIRQMIAENDSWRELRKQPKAAKPQAPAPPKTSAEALLQWSRAAIDEVGAMSTLRPAPAGGTGAMGSVSPIGAGGRAPSGPSPGPERSVGRARMRDVERLLDVGGGRQTVGRRGAGRRSGAGVGLQMRRGPVSVEP